MDSLLFQMQSTSFKSKKSSSPKIATQCPPELESIIHKTIKINPEDPRSYEEILKERAVLELTSYLRLIHRRLLHDDNLQHCITTNEHRLYNLLCVLKNGQAPHAATSQDSRSESQN